MPFTLNTSHPSFVQKPMTLTRNEILIKPHNPDMRPYIEKKDLTLYPKTIPRKFRDHDQK